MMDSMIRMLHQLRHLPSTNLYVFFSQVTVPQTSFGTSQFFGTKPTNLESACRGSHTLVILAMSAELADG